MGLIISIHLIYFKIIHGYESLQWDRYLENQEESTIDNCIIILLVVYQLYACLLHPTVLEIQLLPECY